MHHQLQQVDQRRRRRRRSSSCRNVVAMSTTDYYPYNGKVLLAAVIFLSIVIAFVLLLHAYARWLLSRRPVVVVVRDVPREPPPPPRRSSATLPGRASEARLSSVSGLDAAVVAALPVFVYGEQGEELECVVCLGPMAAGETGRLLPGCRHAFHAGCIDVWFMSRSTCPICRAEVKADVLPGSEAEAGPTAAGCDQEVVVLLDELAGGDVDEGIMGSGGNGALGVAELMVSVPSPSSAMEDQIIVKGSEPSCSVSSIATSCGCSLKRMLSRSRSSH